MDARSYSTPESREPAHEGDRCISGASVAVGACLCEAVNYAVDRVFEALSQYSDPPGARQQTEQFGTFVTAPREAFGRVSGKGPLTDYDSAGGARRSFCRWRGSTRCPDRAGPYGHAVPGIAHRDPGGGESKPAGRARLTGASASRCR